MRAPSGRRVERAPAGALLALLLAVLALPTASVAYAASAAGASPGDFWEYVGVFTLGGETATLTRRVSVEALEPITVNGTSYDAVRTHTVESVRTETPGEAARTVATTRVTEWSRAAGGGTVRAEESYTAEGQTLRSEYEYDAPCVRSPSPLEVGATARFDCRLVAYHDGARDFGRTTGNATVVRAERVSVPAGAFDALVVEIRRDTCASCVETRWRSTEACAAVREVAVGEQGERFEASLSEYACAATGARSTPAPGGALAAAGAGVAALSAALAARRRR